MATWILTPNEPDPITGLLPSVLGWKFTGATVPDVFEGANTVWLAGWMPQIHPVDASGEFPPLWQVDFVKGGAATVVCLDTQWFTFDGQHVGVLDDATVQAKYTVTQKGQT
jgi:hypothetical protein